METITHLAKTVAEGVRRDIRVRWGIGAGASVLLSAGVLGMGGTIVPSFLQASTTPQVVQTPHPSLIFPTEEQVEGLQVIDMSTSTVLEVIKALPKALRYELMLYNSGADEELKGGGQYTVFVPASANFDYLPKRTIAKLTREQTKEVALGHIVARALPIEESLSGNVMTLGYTMLPFKVDAEADTVTVGGANVVKAYKAQNGMVYLIDKVLLSQGN